jgi:deoxyribose-phosphate aldolase
MTPPLSDFDLAQTLDAAVLGPHLTADEADAAIRACIAMRCKTACVRPVDVARARRLCDDADHADTGVCAVVGFPHGTHLIATKADETKALIELGADEIDVVLHYGAARAADYTYLQDEVSAVVEAAGEKIVKTIFETSQLELATIPPLVEAAALGGAAFIKTSTGFTGEGASEPVVRAMLDTLAKLDAGLPGTGRVRVKPAGGIRDRATAQRYLAMGAARLGVGWTSAQAILGGDATDAAY